MRSPQFRVLLVSWGPSGGVTRAPRARIRRWRLWSIQACSDVRVANTLERGEVDAWTRDRSRRDRSPPGPDGVAQVHLVTSAGQSGVVSHVSWTHWPGHLSSPWRPLLSSSRRWSPPTGLSISGALRATARGRNGESLPRASWSGVLAAIDAESMEMQVANCLSKADRRLQDVAQETGSWAGGRCRPWLPALDEHSASPLDGVDAGEDRAPIGL